MLALASQMKAAAAQDEGRFKKEITPVPLPQKRAIRSCSRRMNS